MKNFNTAISKGLVSLQTGAFIMGQKMKRKLSEQAGTAFMDNGLLMVIGVVIAGIALALLVAFLKEDLAPNIKTKTNGFFNFT